jgi:hypothetical protein
VVATKPPVTFWRSLGASLLATRATPVGAVILSQPALSVKLYEEVVGLTHSQKGCRLVVVNSSLYAGAAAAKLLRMIQSKLKLIIRR